MRLHESLPIWLITGNDLERLRTEKTTGKRDIRDYMHETKAWLHLLYRKGKPFGYVHAEQRPKQSHKVTNVSVTGEADLIRRAVEVIDHASQDESAQAGICECPKAGLAGVIAVPGKIGEEPLVCIYRDPDAAEGWSPAGVITGTELLERLRSLHVVRGPDSKR